MLDGVDMNDAIDNLIAYQPSPDAVEQVSVETNNYSPELGNVAGAVVNMVIKSGTNNVSGNAFYYWRDNELAATSWAINRAGGRKPEFTRKIFGGTVGGPIAQGQAVLLRRLPGRAPGVAASRRVRHGHPRRMAARRPQQPAEPAPRRSSCAIRATGQPFPNNQIPVEPLQPVRAQPAGQRGALSARQHAAAAERLPPELSRPGRFVAAGQPVRRQGRLERVDQRQGLRALLEAGARDHAGSDGDAAAVRLAVREPVLERRRQLEPHHRHDAGQRPADRLQRQQLQRHADRPERRRAR